MPRITADTVAEHSRLQKAAVLDAAIQLFTERGIDNVSLSDIAAKVGLARNSIYRYFPDRNHLIAAWFDHEIEPLAKACEEILGQGQTPWEQLDSWVNLHLSYLRMPGHREMIAAVSSTTDLPESAHAHLIEGHERVYGPLRKILGSLRHGRDDTSADLALLGALVASLVNAGSTAPVTKPASAERIGHAVLSAIHGTVSGFDPTGSSPAGSSSTGTSPAGSN
ncbi:MAG TPA: TetR/AcrR family transcriptional regulator [Microthrixaceae bacterium]|nr:TetR/AcrR family transcriptional regulator [Microthrixaceae bacterium]